MSIKSQMSKYIIRSVLFLLTVGLYFQANGQFKSDQYYGIRIGTDLSRIPVHFLNKYRTDITFHADARVDTDLYVAAEVGWNTTHLDNKPTFEYKGNGYFLKAGIDYNLLNPSFPFESNMVYVGLRYGIARMEQEVPTYTIDYPYWGDVKGSFPYKTVIPQWGEAILGMKVEVFDNLFLSWAIHLRLLITRNFDNDLRPYLIPGFGKATSNTVFDANYNISYRIPLWKPKPKKPKKIAPPDQSPLKEKKGKEEEKSKKEKKK